MMQNNELGMIPIFHGLDNVELEHLSEQVQVQKFKRRTLIFQEGEISTRVHIILSGVVKLCRFLDNGREVISNIIGRNGIFGEISVLEEAEVPYNVLCLTQVETISLSRDDFLDALNKLPGLTHNLTSFMFDRQGKMDARIENLALNSSSERVAYSILRLAEDIGERHNGSVEIDWLPMQSDLANYAGTCRETASRVLKLFQKEGFFKRSGQRLVISDFDRFKREYPKYQHFRD